MKKLLLVLVGLSCLIQLSYADKTFTQRDDVKSYITHVAKQYQFEANKLTILFRKIRLRPEVIAAFNKPYEAKPWYIYRKHFINQARIKGGVKFWRQHKAVLARAEKKFGVPAKIIVAIIGVESSYGKHRGKYSVLNTLATLAFDYPRRAKYFQKELTQFLILSREQQWNPTVVLGSYAGAVGQPQFMPSSYRAYGIDFSNHNGKINLFSNLDDIIGSVANYLAKHGWQRNQAIYVQAKVTGDRYQTLSQKNRKPRYTLKQLSSYNIKPVNNYSAKTKAYFFTVKESDKKLSYWLGFQNFYAITRYNWSNLYALAVSQLADKISAAYNKGNHK